MSPAVFLLGGREERERLEEFDAGKPLPPYDESAKRDDSFGD